MDQLVDDVRQIIEKLGEHKNNFVCTLIDRTLKIVAGHVPRSKILYRESNIFDATCANSTMTAT